MPFKLIMGRKKKKKQYKGQRRVEEKSGAVVLNEIDEVVSKAPTAASAGAAAKAKNPSWPR